MGNFLAITVTTVAIIFLLVLFYYVFIYLKLKPGLKFIDTIGMTQEQMKKSKPQRLIDTHQQKVIRPNPPKLSHSDLITILDGIMQVEFSFKRYEYELQDYFIYDDLNELTKKMTATIYCDMSPSLIHDLEYYYDKEFVFKFISRAVRDFINELMIEKNKRVTT